MEDKELYRLLGQIEGTCKELANSIIHVDQRQEQNFKRDLDEHKEMRMYVMDLGKNLESRLDRLHHEFEKRERERDEKNAKKMEEVLAMLAKQGERVAVNETKVIMISSVISIVGGAIINNLLF